MFSSSFVHVSFDPKVIVKEKGPIHDVFKYIIDVGSSLGLWFCFLVIYYKPATVVQHVAHPLVDGEVIGMNFGLISPHN